MQNVYSFWCCHLPPLYTYTYLKQRENTWWYHQPAIIINRHCYMHFTQCETYSVWGFYSCLPNISKTLTNIDLKLWEHYFCEPSGRFLSGPDHTCPCGASSTKVQIRFFDGSTVTFKALQRIHCKYTVGKLKLRKARVRIWGFNGQHGLSIN